MIDGGNFMKKLIITVLSMIACLGLTACGGESANDNPKNKVETEEGKIQGKSNEGIKEIELGEKVIVKDVAEFTFEKIKWQEEVKPSNTEGVFTYFEKKNGETFLTISGKLKNLSNSEYNPQFMTNVILQINGKYDFNGDFNCEVAEGNSFHGRPKPLQTLDAKIIIPVSNEAKNEFEKGKMTLKVVSDSSKVQDADDDTPFETFILNFK